MPWNATLDESGDLTRADEPSNEPQAIPKYPSDQFQDSSLDGVLSELGGQSHIVMNVYREPGKGKRLEFLFSASPDNFTFGQVCEKVRDEYGGGDYRIQIRRHNQLICNRPFAVAAPLASIEKPEEKQADTIMEMMRAMMERTERQAMENQRLMLQVVQSAMQRPEPVQHNPLDQFRTFVELQQMLQPQRSETNPIELLKSVIELQQDASLASKEPDNAFLLKLVDKFGGPLLELTKGMQKQQNLLTHVPQRSVKAPAQVKAKTEQSSMPAESTQSSVGTDQTFDKIEDDNDMAGFGVGKTQLMMLCGFAARNSNTQSYADLILDNIPDGEPLEQAIAHLRRDDVIEELAKIHPPVLQHREWFERLKADILAQIVDETDEGDAAEQANIIPDERSEATDHQDLNSDA